MNLDCRLHQPVRFTDQRAFGDLRFQRQRFQFPVEFKARLGGIDEDGFAAVRKVFLKNATDKDLRLFLTVLFYTGARRGEASILSWDDVNLRKREIIIRQPKQGTVRTCYIHNVLFMELTKVPQEDRAGGLFRWESTSGHRKPLAALCKKLGIKLTPHMCRHTFASIMRDKGADLADIQEAGGWKSINSVRRYAAESKVRQRKAIQKL